MKEAAYTKDTHLAEWGREPRFIQGVARLLGAQVIMSVGELWKFSAGEVVLPDHAMNVTV